jgi:protein O-mannosyl-transferase
MGLDGRQKKYIKKNLRSDGLDAVCEDLGLAEDEVLEYLERKWSKEKFSDFKKDLKFAREEDLISRVKNFNFLGWVKKNRFHLLILALLVIGVYANSLSNEFVSDDVSGILNNPRRGDLDYAFERPLVLVRMLSMFFSARFLGGSPAAFRFLNILFHLANCFLIYLLASLLVNRRAAFFGSALCAVHPLMVESVTWISGGGYPTYGFFLLLGILLYLFSFRHRRFYYFSAIAFLLALLSSEKALVFPFILVSLHLAYSAYFKNWKKLIIPSLLGLVWVGLYVGMIPTRVQNLEQTHYQESTFMNPLIQIPTAIGTYLQLTLWPAGLTLYHTDLLLSVPQFVLKVLFTLSYVAGLVYSYFRKREYFFWLSLLGIVLLPTLTPLGISWVVAERYVYLGLFGLLIAVGMLFSRMASKKEARGFAVGLFVVIMVALSVRTVVRNTDWKNEDTLWLAAERVSSPTAQNHNNLGDMYMRQGDFDQAIEEFQAAIEMKPHYADAHHNLANVYVDKRLFEEAEASYLQAIEHNPLLWQSHQNLAGFYVQMEDYESAQEHLDEAIKINPENPQLRLGLASLFYQKGDLNQAVSTLEALIEDFPDYQQAREFLIQVQLSE